MNFLLLGCLVSKDSFLPRSARGKIRLRGGLDGGDGGSWGPLPLLPPTAAPPLPYSQVPRMGRVADGLGWMGWLPICPLPPLSLEPRGMVGGCGPLQSGSSPFIFLEGAEELVAMEMEKREEGCREILGSGRDPHLRPFESYILTTHKHISQHPWSWEQSPRPGHTDPLADTQVHTQQFHTGTL